MIISDKDKENTPEESKSRQRGGETMTNRQRLESIEAYRQNLTTAQQANLLRTAYRELSDSDRAAYFSLFYQALQRVRREKRGRA